MSDKVIVDALFHAQMILEDLVRQDEPEMTWAKMVETWPLVYGPIDEALKLAGIVP